MNLEKENKMKKYIFLILLPFLTLDINSQEVFDKDFLDSLPDDIKDDVMQRSDEKRDGISDNYSAYQYSSKLREKEELEKLKRRLEFDLKELERRLSGDEKLFIEDDLELFGSNFFNTFQTSFMPINEPNPDSGYVLDVGDVLDIQLVGQNSSIKEFQVGGDGSVNIPDIGKIVVAGLNLNEASSLIKSKVSSAFIGTEAFITINKVRDVNILVSGNAANPGIYTLTGNSNVLQALSASGGISEFGSYREINLIRDNKVIETLDVYDLLIEGNYSLSKRLRSGDVIFVESRKNVISIDGAVKRPAKYEVADDEFLDSVIRFSNGIKQTADLENISLNRLLDGTLKSIPIRNVSPFSSVRISKTILFPVRSRRHISFDLHFKSALISLNKSTRKLQRTLVIHVFGSKFLCSQKYDSSGTLSFVSPYSY